MLSRTDLFISHSSQDQGSVAALCEALHSYGISTWFSSGHNRIRAGELWNQHVEDALKAGDQFLLVVSERAMASPHVRDEIQRARDLKKHFIIVSLESESDTLQLMQNSGFNFLSLVVVENVRFLRREDHRDPLDESARKIASIVKGKSTKRALRSLTVACAAACLVIYGGHLLSNASSGAGAAKNMISRWLPSGKQKDRHRVSVTPPSTASSVSRPTPPVAAAAVARTGAAVPVAPAPIQKPFAIPRFLKNPEISLRSRLLGTWTATGSEQVSFNLQYRDGKFEGSARIGDKCRLTMNSSTVEPGYVVLRALPGRESCSIKGLHIGYRNSERIQIVVEGGDLSSQSFYRDL